MSLAVQSRRLVPYWEVSVYFVAALDPEFPGIVRDETRMVDTPYTKKIDKVATSGATFVSNFLLSNMHLKSQMWLPRQMLPHNV